MGSDKKGIAELLVSGMGPRPNVEKPAMDESDSGDEGLRSSAEEIISAIQSGDADGLVSSLKAFIEMSEGVEDSEE